jgi:hypothetical protein
MRVEAGRAKERAVFFARPVNDSLMDFLVVEKSSDQLLIQYVSLKITCTKELIIHIISSQPNSPI